MKSSSHSLLLLALLCVFFEHFTKVIPATFGDQDRVTKVTLDFADGDVTPLRILFAREEEVFVLDANMTGLGSLGGSFSFPVVVLLDEFLQMIIELFHTVGRDEDLEPRISPCECLRDFEEPASRVFLNISSTGH